jgi:hypothetical protein
LEVEREVDCRGDLGAYLTVLYVTVG